MSTSPPLGINSVVEIAKRLGVHEQTVRKWIRGGELGHHRLGARIVITDEQLATFLDEHRVDPS